VRDFRFFLMEPFRIATVDREIADPPRQDRQLIPIVAIWISGSYSQWHNVDRPALNLALAKLICAADSPIDPTMPISRRGRRSGGPRSGRDEE
jgi:hypothetical protein